MSGMPNDIVSNELVAAPAVVVLVIDGLGWFQLQRWAERAPVMSGLGERVQRAEAVPITTVAPSTTAAALTSITTGVGPGEHGLIGYRVPTAAGVMNSLRWWASGREVQQEVPPADLQPVEPFLGRPVTVVTRSEFRGTGFTAAHLRGADWAGWYTPYTLVTQAVEAVEQGQRMVYAYYDGLDKVGHVHGLGVHFQAELAFADHLVERLVMALPAGTQVVVTADHGMIEVADRLVPVHPSVLSGVAYSSGEARFMWLHARRGAAGDVLDAAAVHENEGWVVGREQVLDEGWLGPRVRHEARERLGDVALVGREPVAFVEPDAPDSPWLVGRHGGLTAEEMVVPMLRFVA